MVFALLISGVDIPVTQEKQQTSDSTVSCDDWYEN